MNRSAPLLTIATVTRNCAPSIAATLQSVASVKRDLIEYVVVDGASTDGTLEHLKAATGLIDRLVSEPDTGIYNAMNKAVGLARGDYVLFINGDDELVSDGFDVVMRALANRAGDIICATTLVGSAQQPTEKLVAEPWKLFFHNSIPHPSAFTSRELLQRFPFREDLQISSDYDFFLRSLLARRRFHAVAEVTALHHRGGASGDVMKSVSEVEKVRRDHLGLLYPIALAVSRIYRSLRSRKSDEVK